MFKFRSLKEKLAGIPIVFRTLKQIKAARKLKMRTDANSSRFRDTFLAAPGLKAKQSVKGFKTKVVGGSHARKIVRSHVGKARGYVWGTLPTQELSTPEVYRGRSPKVIKQMTKAGAYKENLSSRKWKAAAKEVRAAR